MLKIQRSAMGAFVLFTLSGRIQAADVTELQRLFDCEANKQHITVDLHEVKLVDREAVHDGNLITSRSPADLGAFCRTIIQALSEGGD